MAVGRLDSFRGTLVEHHIAAAGGRLHSLPPLVGVLTGLFAITIPKA